MASHQATRLPQIARRDFKMARRRLDPDVEEASWGWTARQCLEKNHKTWLCCLGTKYPQTHVLVRLLLLWRSACNPKIPDHGRSDGNQDLSLSPGTA
jgi:HEPN domain-containing protein